MIKVFFDDLCSLCSKEIHYYRSLNPINPISWEPISESKEALEKLGISHSRALQELHVLTEDNQIHVGVDAFISIWSALPYWQWLAKVAAIKPINLLLIVVYKYFAKRRFKNLNHCQVALKKTQAQSKYPE